MKVYKKSGCQPQKKKWFDKWKWIASIKAFLIWLLTMMSMWLLALTSKISDEATSTGIMICAVVLVGSYIVMRKAFYKEYMQKQEQKAKVKREMKKYE